MFGSSMTRRQSRPILPLPPASASRADSACLSHTAQKWAYSTPSTAATFDATLRPGPPQPTRATRKRELAPATREAAAAVSVAPLAARRNRRRRIEPFGLVTAAGMCLRVGCPARMFASSRVCGPFLLDLGGSLPECLPQTLRRHDGCCPGHVHDPRSDLRIGHEPGGASNRLERHEAEH